GHLDPTGLPGMNIRRNHLILLSEFAGPPLLPPDFRAAFLRGVKLRGRHFIEGIAEADLLTELFQLLFFRRVGTFRQFRSYCQMLFSGFIQCDFGKDSEGHREPLSPKTIVVSP
ncbi:MAG: hypothetical protein RKP46_12560, partial [Candidatus Accumulibacter sp.]